ncbi:MAG: methylmalonyl-CoA epimerase [Acidobacteriota bacterium]
MKIEHIGVAVASLAEGRSFYEALGIPCAGEEEVPEQKVKAAFFSVGESRVELLESTDPQGPVGKFLAKRGPGLHHLCIEVPDLEAVLEGLKAKGYALLDERPRIGAGGRKVAFVHPKSAAGVLLELTEGEGR